MNKFLRPEYNKIRKTEKHGRNTKMKYVPLLALACIIAILLKIIAKHFLFCIRIRQFSKRTNASFRTTKKLWWIGNPHSGRPEFYLSYPDRVYAIKLVSGVSPLNNAVIFRKDLKYTTTKLFFDWTYFYTRKLSPPTEYPYNLAEVHWKNGISIQDYGKEIVPVALFFPAPKYAFLAEKDNCRRIFDGTPVNGILFCGQKLLLQTIQRLYDSSLSSAGLNFQVKAHDPENPDRI